MANTWYSVLLLLVVSRQAYVDAYQTEVDVHEKNVPAQYGAMRLPRGLLDGLVGAVLSPVLGAGGNDCSSARGDSINIGATLPLGISAGIAGSSADARSRPGCSAAAGSNSVGANSGAGASAGSNPYGAGGSQTTAQSAQVGHGSEDHGGSDVYGQGTQQGSFGSGSTGTGLGWGSQTASHSGSGSAGQTRTSASNHERGFSSGGGFVGGAPVRGEAATVGESSSQSSSASTGQGGLIAGEHGRGNMGGVFNGYGGGHDQELKGHGVGSSNSGSNRHEVRGDGLNQDGGSRVIGFLLSNSTSSSRASSSAGSSIGARPGAPYSSSRSDANSS